MEKCLVSLGYRAPVWEETPAASTHHTVLPVAGVHGSVLELRVDLCFRYTGHCPLLRFSMGQPYGQVTGQLLRGAPGVAWPPAHRTLLPPIRSPQCPVISRLPPRRGHERLGSHMIPGYTGVYRGQNGDPLIRVCVLN